jgi:predicted small metal-binding protein
MAYSIRCADSGAECPGVFTTKTEDELMQHVQVHAAVAHPDMELTPELVAQFKGLVRVV